MFRFTFFFLRLALSCGVAAGIYVGAAACLNNNVLGSASLPIVATALVSLVVSVAVGVDLFIVLGRLGRGRKEPSGEEEPSDGRSKGAGNAEGLRNPKHALVEHLVVPGHGQLSDVDVETLQATIGQAVKGARIQALTSVELRRKGVVALVDAKYGLVVWAFCQNEVSQVKVSVHYAERNKMKWCPRQATNWNFDGSMHERDRAVRQQSSAGLPGIGLQLLAASYAPVLSRRRAERAESLKASFSGLLAKSIDEWLTRQATRTAEAPTVAPVGPSARRRRN